jgi:transcriptional regulator with XRE-family HTH domain
MFQLIQERIKQQCTIRQMAARTGWSYSAIWNYEQGIKRVPLAYIEHAAEVLGFHLTLRRNQDQ